MSLGVVPQAREQTTPVVVYRITATIQPGEPVSAQAVISVPRAWLTETESLRLRLNRAITLIRARDTDSQPVELRRLEDSSLAVVAPRSTSDRLELSLDYQVAADTSARRQLGYTLHGSTGWHDAWYPVVIGLPDSLRRFRRFDLTLEVPRSTAVLATGARIDSSSRGSRARYRFRADQVEGAMLAYGDGHTVLSIDRDSFRVRVFAPEADRVTFRRVGEESVRAAQWYQETYGFFPVKEMGIVPGYRTSRGGFPYPHVFMIHRGDLSPPFVRWITAHELAHYYWGLYVFDADERLGWLMLALGIWTDQLYLARTAGRALEAQWRHVHGDNSFQEYAQAAVADYDLTLGLPESRVDSLNYDYNSLVRHAKGATGVYLMALRLGTDRFVALQRRLLEQYRDRPLSPQAFGEELEAAGVAGATRFLRAWARPDARLDYAVRLIRRQRTDPASWIVVDRTGTIPFPVTIEARPRSGDGKPVRVSLSGDLARDSIRVPAMVEDVLLDPDGLLPMWSSDNLDMRRVFLRAMGVSGPVGPFLALVSQHLRTDPDPHLAALAIERLFELGRYVDVAAIGDQVKGFQCEDRPTCLAMVQLARALGRLGRRPEATRLLDRVTGEMQSFGLVGPRRLDQARQELTEPSADAGSL